MKLFGQVHTGVSPSLCLSAVCPARSLCPPWAPAANHEPQRRCPSPSCCHLPPLESPWGDRSTCPRLQDRNLEALVKRFKTDLHNCVAYIQEPRLLKEKVRALFEKYVQRADLVSPAPLFPALTCSPGSPPPSLRSPSAPSGRDRRAELRPAAGGCPAAGAPGEKPGRSQEEGGQGEGASPH